MIVVPLPSYLSSTALAELLQVDLITTKEAMGLKDPSDVVRVQSTKAPEVMDATAGFLQRKDFVDELDLLKGMWTRLSTTY